MLFVATVSIFQNRCILLNYDEDLRKEETEYTKISSIPLSNESERIRVFNEYAVERQIDIYLFARCCVQPSDPYFMDYIVFNGKTKINKITEVLKIKKRPMDRSHLMDVLNEIDRDCLCVGSDVETMKSLKLSSQVIELNDDKWDKEYRELIVFFLNEIEKRKK
jgi:hypothetical protein